MNSHSLWLVDDSGARAPVRRLDRDIRADVDHRRWLRLRFLGGAIVRAAMARKDRKVIVGGAESLLDRALTRLAPSGVEDKG